MSYDDDLRLAHVLADAVERVTMSRFRAEDLHVESKPDLTPVTDADRSAEELVRMQLKRTRPRDAEPSKPCLACRPRPAAPYRTTSRRACHECDARPQVLRVFHLAQVDRQPFARPHRWRRRWARVPRSPRAACASS